jgi:hypothetical protein
VLGYTSGMVRDMCELCGEVPQHVTFAASAAHLFASAAGRGFIRHTCALSRATTVTDHVIG